MKSLKSIMIYLGADHGGYQLKEKIKKWLLEWGYEFEDCGNEKMEPEDDYPEFAFKVAESVKRKAGSRGILACRSAAGMVVAANKVRGIRAVAVFDEESARHSRKNNDANIVALSGEWLSDEKAKEVLKIWLTTEFSGEERHVRRIKAIEKYEA